MDKVHVRVNICGVECGILSDESENYVYSIADEISETVRKIKFSSPGLSRSVVDVLAMMDLCDKNKKLLKQKTEIENLCKKLEEENKNLKSEIGVNSGKYKGKK